MMTQQRSVVLGIQIHGEELEQTRDRTFDALLFLVMLEHDFFTPNFETPKWSLCSPHVHRSSLDTEPLRRVSSVAEASGFAWEHNKGGHRAGPGPGPTAPRKVDSLQPHGL